MSRRVVLLLLCNFQAGKLLKHWFTECCPAHIVAGRMKCVPKHNTEKKLTTNQCVGFCAENRHKTKNTEGISISYGAYKFIDHEVA